VTTIINQARIGSMRKKSCLKSPKIERGDASKKRNAIMRIRQATTSKDTTFF
jgi:hypothetical protein